MFFLNFLFVLNNRILVEVSGEIFGTAVVSLKDTSTRLYFNLWVELYNTEFGWGGHLILRAPHVSSGVVWAQSDMKGLWLAAAVVRVERPISWLAALRWDLSKVISSDLYQTLIYFHGGMNRELKPARARRGSARRQHRMIRPIKSRNTNVPGKNIR